MAVNCNLNKNKKRQVLTIVWRRLEPKTKGKLQAFMKSQKTGVRALNKMIRNNITSRYPVMIKNRACELEKKPLQSKKGASKALHSHQNKIRQNNRNAFYNNNASKELFKRVYGFNGYSVLRVR